MNCPHCRGLLCPWVWNDGGHRGVECPTCDIRWFSRSFENASYEAKKAAVEQLLAASEFPADAEKETSLGRRLRINLTRDRTGGDE